MSIGTFMDSVLFSVQCGLSNTIGNMGHILDPITPESVWERRRAEADKAISSMVISDDLDEEKSQFPEGDPRESFRKSLRENPILKIKDLSEYLSEEEREAMELETAKEAKAEFIVSVPDVER